MGGSGTGFLLVLVFTLNQYLTGRALIRFFMWRYKRWAGVLSTCERLAGGPSSGVSLHSPAGPYSERKGHRQKGPLDGTVV